MHTRRRRQRVAACREAGPSVSASTMIREAATSKALAFFDRVVADRERSNITAMLADDVDPDALDTLIGEAPQPCGSRGGDYAAFVACLLDT